MQTAATKFAPPVDKPQVPLPSRLSLKQLKAFSPSVVPAVGMKLAQEPVAAAMQLGPVSY